MNKSPVQQIKDRAYVFGLLVHELQLPSEVKETITTLATTLEPEQFDALFLVISEAVSEQLAIELDPVYQEKALQLDKKLSEELSALIAKPL